MPKKKQSPQQAPRPPASRTVSGEEALSRIMKTIRTVREMQDSDGNQIHPGIGDLDALETLLRNDSEDFLVDQYYMICGFESLQELDLKIIRADMLVERATRSFAESRAGSPKEIDGLRQYAAIRNFAKAMTEPSEDSSPWVAAKHLSDARNSVAHQLENVGVEKHLVEFFKAVGISPDENFENIEQAVMMLCGCIFTMKQNWLQRKSVYERLYREHFTCEPAPTN